MLRRVAWYSQNLDQNSFTDTQEGMARPLPLSECGLKSPESTLGAILNAGTHMTPQKMCEGHVRRVAGKNLEKIDTTGVWRVSGAVERAVWQQSADEARPDVM